MSVKWKVDLKTFKTSEHRASRTFTLDFAGSDVPFVLMLKRPENFSAKDARSTSGSKKSAVEAIMQIKCTAETMPLVHVSFGIGGQVPRTASCSHNFTEKVICELPPDNNIWDLSAGSEDTSKGILVQVDLFP